MTRNKTLWVFVLCFASVVCALAASEEGWSADEEDLVNDSPSEVEDGSDLEDSDDDKDIDNETKTYMLSLEHMMEKPSDFEYKIKPDYFQTGNTDANDNDGFPLKYKNPFDYLEDFQCKNYVPEKDLRTGIDLNQRIPTLAKCLMMRFGNPFDLSSEPLTISHMACEEKCKKFFESEYAQCVKLCHHVDAEETKPKEEEKPSPVVDRKALCEKRLAEGTIKGWSSLSLCMKNGYHEEVATPKPETEEKKPETEEKKPEASPSPSPEYEHEKTCAQRLAANELKDFNDVSFCLLHEHRDVGLPPKTLEPPKPIGEDCPYCSSMTGHEYNLCVMECKHHKDLELLLHRATTHVYPHEENYHLDEKACMLKCHFANGMNYFLAHDPTHQDPNDIQIKKVLDDLIQDSPKAATTVEPKAEEKKPEAPKPESTPESTPESPSPATPKTEEEPELPGSPETTPIVDHSEIVDKHFGWHVEPVKSKLRLYTCLYQCLSGN